MLDVNIKLKAFQSALGTRLEAIRDLQFSVPAQSFVCVLGPSGCGKTTTLRMILGLDSDYQGEVSVGGNGRVAAVFQEPRLLPWRTVRQNVELCISNNLSSDELAELFEQLGLSKLLDFYPSELSLGLARRVALSRAFAIKPELMILDEPFVSLDDDTAARLRALLLSVWQARPTTALMVTHNVREAAELADTVLLFADRPTRVIGKVPITRPRQDRDAAFIESVLDQCAAIQQQEPSANTAAEPEQ